ncbi:MAG: hypothetical protein JXR67_10335 [Bacteroidales bacterium]|nr:hypothetical protein [Bacteroidales bacterium]
MLVPLKLRLLLILAFSSVMTFVQGSYPAEKPDTLFLSDEILNIELRSDFTAIRADTAAEPVYVDGKLLYHTPDGKTQIFDVKVRARGDFRRNPEICSFPPLRINFKKKEVENTIFMNEDKLKLVTPCQREEDVLEEYLIYKMYNRVTDLSLNVRLVRISYYDTSTEIELFERYSFFIEDDDRLAERFHAKKFEGFLTPFDLERENFRIMSIFQYMIGNKDWFITSRRNVIILKPEDTTKALLAVPYDFDFAGLIDASYTKPRNVPERFLSPRKVYKGLCYTSEEYDNTFEYFWELKPVFESILEEEKLISRATIIRNLRYLDEFYATIQDDDSFRNQFLVLCQTRRMYNLPEN